MTKNTINFNAMGRFQKGLGLVLTDQGNDFVIARAHKYTTMADTDFAIFLMDKAIAAAEVQSVQYAVMTTIKQRVLGNVEFSSRHLKAAVAEAPVIAAEHKAAYGNKIDSRWAALQNLQL